MTIAADRCWIERLRDDASLQAFVAAEIVRAGIERDTLLWQRDHDRVRIASLITQLDVAEKECTRLRRRLGRDRHQVIDEAAS